MIVMKETIEAIDNIVNYISDADIVANNIFLLEKPKEINAIDYICFNFRELDGAKSVRDYQLDLLLVSSDALRILEMKEKLIKLLDIYYMSCPIPKVRSCRMLNGGGLARNEETDEYNCYIYFNFKL